MRSYFRRLSVSLYTVSGATADVVLGRACAVCHKPLYGERYRGSGVCRECTAEFHASHLRYCSVCAVCGRPLSSEAGICTTCRAREQSPEFVDHRSCLEYAGAGGALVTAFKMRAVRRVGVLAGELMEPIIPAVDCIVSVPSGSAAGGRRSFQPVEVLAQVVSTRTGMPYICALGKRGGGRDQKKLDRSQREDNVHDRFLLRLPESAIAGARVCLVDDVYTTGATARECARVLLRDGHAHTVHVRTLAID